MKHILILNSEPDGTYSGKAEKPLDNPAGFDVSLKICSLTKKAIIVLDERINR